ncbi:GAF domain-containing protein [Endozoicomonadaceae bacterium StTr2]
MSSAIFSQRHHWQQAVDQLAADTGLHSILIMESLPDTMKVVCANGSQDIYHEGDAGPKSVQPGCHELYCERVVNTGEELFVADAAIEDEWKGNEDLVKFGLGVYLGLPVRQNGEIVGTVCALHDQPFDFEAGEVSTRERLYVLQQQIETRLTAD